MQNTTSCVVEIKSHIPIWFTDFALFSETKSYTEYSKDSIQQDLIKCPYKMYLYSILTFSLKLKTDLLHEDYPWKELMVEECYCWNDCMFQAVDLQSQTWGGVLEDLIWFVVLVLTMQLRIWMYDLICRSR